MDDLTDAAAYRPEMIEKVEMLARLLERLDEHPRLRGNLALHGGTALNLFVFPPERLSLDLDLNYIAAEDREQMLADRDACIASVCDVASELGLDARPGKVGHAGCTIKLHYQSPLTGLPDFIKVDLDFLNRVCLLPPQVRQSTLKGLDAEFLVNSPVEVVAGKVRAAASRTVPRDLFDLVRIDEEHSAWTTGDAVLDHHIIFYNAVLSNRFPNHGDLADRARFEGREKDFESILRPVLPSGSRLTSDELLERAIPVLERFTTPTDDAEEGFARALADGELDASKLFEGHPAIAERADRNPVALHKRNGIRIAKERGLL